MRFLAVFLVALAVSSEAAGVKSTLFKGKHRGKHHGAAHEDWSPEKTQQMAQFTQQVAASNQGISQDNMDIAQKNIDEAAAAMLERNVVSLKTRESVVKHHHKGDDDDEIPLILGSSLTKTGAHKHKHKKRQQAPVLIEKNSQEGDQWPNFGDLTELRKVNNLKLPSHH